MTAGLDSEPNEAETDREERGKNVPREADMAKPCYLWELLEASQLQFP